MKYVFLMDPLENVKFDKDTTFMFMLEAHKRGHRVYFLPNGGISHKNGEILFHAEHVEPQ